MHNNTIVILSAAKNFPVHTSVFIHGDSSLRIRFVQNDNWSKRDSSSDTQFECRFFFIPQTLIKKIKTIYLFYDYFCRSDY